MAPPRPAEILPTLAETNTSHIGRLCEKTLAGAPTLLQGFRGYTRGCASAPPRNSTTSKREERPISKHQPLRDPNGYHRRGSGATVGDSPRGPLKQPGENQFLSQKTQTNSQNITHTVTAQWQGPIDLVAPAAHQNGQPQPPLGETPLRSRGTTPH
jgi:hypothetical protein